MESAGHNWIRCIRADHSTDSNADSERIPSRFQLGFRAGFRASVDDQAYAALSAHCPKAYIIEIYVSLLDAFMRNLYCIKEHIY